MKPRTVKIWIGLFNQDREVSSSKHPHLEPSLAKQLAGTDYRRLVAELEVGKVSPPFEFPMAKTRWGRITHAAIFVSEVSNVVMGEIGFNRPKEERFIEAGDTVFVGPITMTSGGRIATTSGAMVEKVNGADKWLYDEAFRGGLKPRLLLAKRAMDELRKAVK